MSVNTLRRIRFGLAFLLGIDPCPLLAQGAGYLTLKESIDLALQQSSKFKNSRTLKEISARNRQSAGNYNLPSLDLASNIGADKTLVGEKSDPEKIYNTQLGLTLGLKIYDNGEGRVKLDQTEIEERESDINLRKSRDDLVLAVSQAWFELANKVNQEALKKQRNALVEKQFAATERQYREGLKTRKDFLRFKSEMQRARIDLAAIGSDIKVAKTRLLRSMSQPLDATWQYALSEPKPSDGAKFVKELPQDIADFSHLPELRLAELKIKSSVIDITLAEKKNAPHVQLGTQLVYGANDFIGTGRRYDEQDKVTWGVTLGVTYNIWDFGSRRNDIRNALARKGIAEVELTELHQDLMARLETLLGAIHKEAEALTLNQELLTLETESYDQLEKGFRLGQLGFLDYITGVTNLLDAKNNYFQSYFGLLSDLSNYHYYRGTLDEFLAHF